jgi:hypothetical protein
MTSPTLRVLGVPTAWRGGSFILEHCEKRMATVLNVNIRSWKQPN